MRYGSVCSGIEAASVAWEPLGWQAQWFAEIEKFPSAVLAHRFPNVPNLGDMTRIPDDAAGIDVLVGGTPCQSFSVAGLRGGMDDDRGNLALEYCRLAGRFRPAWLVWENVPGVLSSNGGRDFGSIVGALVKLGYRCAWRVLDAQHFGVPQRRRRVFLVGHLGGPSTSAAAVLFERHSLQGHSAPIREAGADVAGALTAQSGDGRGWRVGADEAAAGHIVGTLCSSGKAAGSATQQDAEAGMLIPETAYCLNGGSGPRHDGTVETLIPWDPNQITSSENRSNPQPGDPCHTLPASANYAPAIAFHARQDSFAESPQSPPLDTDAHTVGVRTGSTVRRLMPVECERLQGFADGWTDVPYRGKPASDGPRYKAIGNSMAVPVMRWIGERIAAVDAVL